MKQYQITEWCHRFIKETVQAGDLCVDATMGNGHDTVLLSQLAGENGHVYAFDIQEIALANTRALLAASACPANTTLLLESHEQMEHYCENGSVSCITFNFGYLPGGDHAKSTKASSSIAAIHSGLSLLKIGGLMSLCIYSGGDTGFEERDAILSYIKGLDSKTYLVIKSDYYNRPNNPPIPVLIIRLK